MSRVTDKYLDFKPFLEFCFWDNSKSWPLYRNLSTAPVQSWFWWFLHSLGCGLDVKADTSGQMSFSDAITLCSRQWFRLWSWMLRRTEDKTFLHAVSMSQELLQRVVLCNRRLQWSEPGSPICLKNTNSIQYRYSRVRGWGRAPILLQKDEWQAHYLKSIVQGYRLRRSENQIPAGRLNWKDQWSFVFFIEHDHAHISKRTKQST